MNWTQGLYLELTDWETGEYGENLHSVFPRLVKESREGWRRDHPREERPLRSAHQLLGSNNSTACGQAPASTEEPIVAQSKHVVLSQPSEDSQETKQDRC